MVFKELIIDFGSQEAIYLQLRNQIVMAIAKEQIHEGESLPSVRQLAECLGVNMHTVNKAYSLLKQDGYLQLDRRKGAVVAIHVSDNKQIEVKALHESVQMIVAEAICKDISRDEFYQIIGNMYDNFEKDE